MLLTQRILFQGNKMCSIFERKCTHLIHCVFVFDFIFPMKRSNDVEKDDELLDNFWNCGFSISDCGLRNYSVVHFYSSISKKLCRCRRFKTIPKV